MVNLKKLLILGLFLMSKLVTLAQTEKIWYDDFHTILPNWQIGSICQPSKNGFHILPAPDSCLLLPTWEIKKQQECYLITQITLPSLEDRDLYYWQINIAGGNGDSLYLEYSSDGQIWLIAHDLAHNQHPLPLTGWLIKPNYQTYKSYLRLWYGINPTSNKLYLRIRLKTDGNPNNDKVNKGVFKTQTWFIHHMSIWRIKLGY